MDIRQAFKKSKHSHTVDEPPKFIVQEKDGGDVVYTSTFVSKFVADNWLTRIKSEVTPKESHVVLYGKTMKIPRLQTAFGDEGLSYRFSGVEVPALEWTPTLLEMKDAVEKSAGCTFNYVLVNLYENGHKYIGYHSDDESDLQKGFPIASVSLGATRKFYVRHKYMDDTRQVFLEHGSLLLMRGDTQKNWKHSLPQMKKVIAERWNFTFRNMNKNKH